VVEKKDFSYLLKENNKNHLRLKVIEEKLKTIN
jgi:hypothetical protein